MRAKVAFCSEAPGMALEEDGYASVLMVLIAQGGRGLQTTAGCSTSVTPLTWPSLASPVLSRPRLGGIRSARPCRS